MGLHIRLTFSSKVNALSKKFDQLLCMNKWLIPLLCKICVQFVLNSMHASFDYPYVGPSDVMTEQDNTAQVFPPTNIHTLNTYNHG